MTLRELLGDGPDVVVTSLTFDNRLVAEGTLFFCVPGFTRDGHDFAPDAVAKGAAALVVQRPLGLGVPEVVVDDVRAAMGPVAARFHGDPTARLRVVGITGTNGKTTTAFLLRDVLAAAGVLEVSSHALALDGPAGIRFACRVFTNLTQDHLDFHSDMEDYFLAKRRLFLIAGLAADDADADATPGTAVVNADDDYGARLAEELRQRGAPLLTFSA